MKRLLLIGLALCAGWASADHIVIRDVFGRDVTKTGITLLDWDGEMANPMVKLRIEIDDTKVPLGLIDARPDCPRIMFDPCPDIDEPGMGRPIYFKPGQKKVDIYVSIFPDRDGKDEIHHIEFKSADGKISATIPVRVIDQDQNTRPSFNILTDFSEDKTGFLANPRAQEVIRQAAADWAYFIDDMSLDPVAVGAEETTLWNKDGFNTNYAVKNKTAYTGFLVYFVGIAGIELRSGGAPSYDGKRQTSKGKTLGLLRSGAVEVETQGNYHRLGYFIDNSEDNWWCSGSHRYEPADLLSIMTHELGHALAFEDNYPVFGKAMVAKKFVDPEVHRYLGKDPALDTSAHFFDSVDPASGFGVFGGEYRATQHVRRWLITKTHLLLLKAIGYKIRPVSCFDLLQMNTSSVELTVDSKAHYLLKAQGGIPDYLWEVVSGSLPDGVTLDRDASCLTGTPKKAGTYKVRLRVTDQGPTPEKVEKDITITVG